MQQRSGDRIRYGNGWQRRGKPPCLPSELRQAYRVRGDRCMVVGDRCIVVVGDRCIVVVGDRCIAVVGDRCIAVVGDRCIAVV
jgi:hypothetical protein